MHRLTRQRSRLTRAVAGYPARIAAWARRSDQGDVPGWVLITIMTAGLVAALWLVAEPLLTDLFTSAISAVSGP